MLKSNGKNGRIYSISTTAFSHAMLGRSDRSFWWVSCRLPSAWMYLSFLGLLRRDPSVEGCILCQKIFRGCAWGPGTRQSALSQRKLAGTVWSKLWPPSSHRTDSHVSVAHKPGQKRAPTLGSIRDRYASPSDSPSKLSRNSHAPWNQVWKLILTIEQWLSRARFLYS